MQRIVAVFLMVALVGCSGVPRNPVDIDDLENVGIRGIEGARYWGDTAPINYGELLAEVEAQRRASGLLGNYSTLSLSGGGEDGAFAAGILTAWSEAGTRPEFLSVTGVSTGALAAPFAFLGPDYDDELRRLYGGLPPESIFEKRALTGILSNASALSSGPLERLIAEYVTPEFLAKIAAEHRRGRRLIVQSTSLDAQRPVNWDLGAIAASGAPNSVEVFRNALLASASIPVVFPPVLIEVETPAGQRDELHVDGGVVSQAFFFLGWREGAGLSGRPTLYFIRNGSGSPEPRTTSASIPAIAMRSIATLTKAQGTNDLLVGYKLANAAGGTYKATWIGDDFTTERPNQRFDRQYMQALFEYGYRRFKHGGLWSNQPPLIEDLENVEIARR
ncbi:patatin-like phospholipase family protein [Tropicimonas marinistellae]|uniref:patatin-like phospholipase family protein n=1 Tax=Tropicimonas marinistellae TaxID=1739787 RepID=UPI000835E072|nr:patatin-like phospholipase family protein [Tropicimonas marinistellae]